MSLNRDLRDALEILGIPCNHDVHVLGASNNAPSIDREPSD